MSAFVLGGDAMIDGLSIPVPGGTNLVFDYVNGRMERHPVNAIVQRLRPIRRGDRVHVHVEAIDSDSDGYRRRTYLAHRILRLMEPDTGEVFDTGTEILARLFRGTGHLPPDAVNPHKRVPGPGIEFGDDGFAVGWAFGVHQAFWLALDILVGPVAGAPRAMVSHGHPRVLAFGPGDLLHAPPGPADRWDRQLAGLTHSVQVLAGGPDTLASDGEIKPGRITYRIVDYRSGATEIRETSQAQFVELLRYGVAPGGISEPGAENSD